MITWKNHCFIILKLATQHSALITNLVRLNHVTIKKNKIKIMEKLKFYFISKLQLLFQEQKILNVLKVPKVKIKIFYTIFFMN